MMRERSKVLPLVYFQIDPDGGASLAQRGERRHVGHIEFHLRGRIEYACPIGGQRLTDIEPAGHPQEVVDRDSAPRVARIRPRSDRRGPVDRQLLLAYEDPTIALMTDLVIDQPIRGVSTPKPGITLGDDPTIAYNDDRLRLAVRRRGAGSSKARVESRLEGRIAWFDEVWPEIGGWSPARMAGSGAQDKCSIVRSKDAGRLVR